MAIAGSTKSLGFTRGKLAVNFVVLYDLFHPALVLSKHFAFYERNFGEDICMPVFRVERVL
jgi:hypothetical protein